MRSRPPEPADDELPDWPDEPKPASRRQGLIRKTSTVVPTRVPHAPRSYSDAPKTRARTSIRVCREALTDTEPRHPLPEAADTLHGCVARMQHGR